MLNSVLSRAASVTVLVGLLLVAVSPVARADAPFVRGDVNADARYDIADPVAGLNFMFTGRFTPPCLDALDVDDDGSLELPDAVRSLNYMFRAGPAPAEPFAGGCGGDTTPDDLDCAGYNSDACPPPSSPSPIGPLLDRLSFDGSESCCLPGLGVFPVRAGRCVSLGGTLVESEADVLACARSGVQPQLVWLQPPPSSVMRDEPFATVEIMLLGLPSADLVQIELTEIGPDGEPSGMGPRAVVEIVPGDVFGDIDVDIVAGDDAVLGVAAMFDGPAPRIAVDLSFEGLARGVYSLVATAFETPPPSALVEVDIDGLGGGVTGPGDVRLPIASVESELFDFNPTGAVVLSLAEVAALESEAEPADPLMSALIADVESFGQALLNVDASMISLEIDSLRRRIRDRQREIDEARRDAAEAEEELDENRRRQEELQDELDALTLVNRMLDTWFDDDALAMLEELIRRRADLIGGAEKDDEEALDEALADKLARLEELCAELEAKKAALEDLEAQHEAMKQSIRDQFQAARDAAGPDSSKIDIQDDTVTFEITGLFVAPNGEVLKHGPINREYREAKKKLKEMIAEYEELWKKILACRDEIAALEKEKAWLEENIELLESVASEVDEIDNILDAWFAFLRDGQVAPHMPHLDRLLEELERVGAGWLADLLRDLFGSAPHTPEELEEFLARLQALRDEKHAREAELEEELEELRRREDELERRIEDDEARADEAKDDIDALEDELRRAEEEARRAAQEAYDEARRQAEEEAARRREEQELDDRIDELRRRAAEGDEDALAQLIELVGLGLLEEVAPNLARFIGAALTIARMPECVCKILKAMKDLFGAQDSFQRSLFANEVIRQWRECANLGWISTIEIGSKELAEAVGDMPASARREVVAALNRALRREGCR